MLRLTATLATAAMLGAAPASARETKTLAPSSAWQVDFGETNCQLIRTFGEGKDLTTLSITFYQPGGTPSLVVMREERLRGSGKAEAQFAPDSSWTELESPLRARFAEGMHGLLFTLPLITHDTAMARVEMGQERREKGDFSPAPEIGDEQRNARERDISELRLRNSFRNDYHLQLGDVHAVMNVARTCLDDLLGQWGIDAEKHRSLSRKAQPATAPTSWLKSRDYPASMLQAGFQGMVDYRVIVDETGKPAECVIQQTSRPDDFAELTCQLLMRRAEFLPALDSDGQPIVSYFSGKVLWVIPKTAR